MHPSRASGPFWPKRAPDRTPITTDSCVFVVALKAAAGATRGGGGISTKNETAKKPCKTPPSTPKDPRETPKTTNHDGMVAPSGHPWPPARGPKRGPRDTLGAPRGPPKQRQTKTQSPLTKNAEDKKRTTKLIVIYKGFALMPFGGVFGETPRHEENSKMYVLLQCWIPRGAKTHENLVFYEGS